MSGIYLHIPFCRQACGYCNFHFSTSTQTMPDVLEAMRLELEMQAKDWEESISSIYFGGGTPSLLDAKEIVRFLELIRRLFKVDGDVEITLEANPEDIEDPIPWKNAGVNRLSIGVQSFFDDELRWMNRIHDAEQSLQAIAKCRNAGFEKLTIDLIYGLPVSNHRRWEENVDRVIQLGIPHISAYALTVEPKTAFAARIAKKVDRAPDDEYTAEQFYHLRGKLRSAGYRHYEISNFALPGKESRHNSSYWKGNSYLGIGPAAHSYRENRRRWNVANNRIYSRKINSGIWFEEENLSLNDQYNEFVMLGLRQPEAGLDASEVRRRFGGEIHSHFMREAESAVGKALTQWRGNSLVLTEKGLFFADGVAADLFLINENI